MSKVLQKKACGEHIPWAEQIPAHWRTVRMKYIFREIDERSAYGSEPLFSLTRNKGLVPQSEVSDRGVTAASLVGYRICSPGDIVMNRMQAWSGLFALASERGLVSPDYTVLRPIADVNPRYMVTQLKLPGMVFEFHRFSKGVGTGFLRLYWQEFGSIRCILPPCDEQDAIISFLDQKWKELDKAMLLLKILGGNASSVAARKDTLLHRYRVSLAHEAITGSLAVPYDLGAPRVS